MTVQAPHPGKLFVPVALLLSLAGCAATPMGPSVQVMPGPGKSFDSFQIDQAYCKGFANDQVRGQADATNQRTAGGAVLGTLVGAGLGAGIGAATGNAGAGAAIGAAAGLGTGAAYGANGAAQSQYSIQVQYDNAYSQCMYAKGDQVPGYTPVSQQSAPSGPAPDPLVRATQQELIRLGYLRDSADGYMGPRTRSAIATFQSARGMAADGAPSRALLGAMQATP